MKPSEIIQPSTNIITHPGKFEGEHKSIPFFWEITLDGTCEQTYRNDTTVFIVPILPDDIKTYPELKPFSRVELWEAENGFIFADFL